MARRLRVWLETHGKLEDSQNGFRTGRSTRDHIFVLNCLIENRLKLKGGKLYVAFVDFRAAFDMVDRELMMEKLRRLGVTGRMLKIIGSIYEKTSNEVIMEEGCTRKFQTSRGVRQGCPLSPTLFNIFLDDVDKDWRRRNEGGTVIGQTKIFALKFADDVALVAENAEGLNGMLNTLARYVKKNRMQVNTAKTKVMVFRKGGKRSKRERWIYGEDEIEEVSSYKYLGFWFTVKNSYSKHLKTLAAKAQVATNAAWGIMKRSKLSGLKRRGYLLDTLVKAILMYGVEIWGWRERTELERMTGRYVKMMLGISRNTPAYIWRMEAGRQKIEVEGRKRAGKYLLNILQMHEERWPKICLKEELRNWANGNGSRWMKQVEAAMRRVGDGVTLEKMRRDEELEEIAEGLQQGCVVLRDQTTQGDWCKIEKSKYCPEYKERTDSVELKEYWMQEDVAGRDKEQWARMRCGNVGRAGNKGYEDEECRICRQGKENLEHISQCTELKKIVSEELKNKVEMLFGNNPGQNDWNRILKGRLDTSLCEYCREFEKAVREKEGKKQDK